MNYRKLRSGPGWKKLPGHAVYEYKDGTRLHMLGTVRLPDGTYIHENKWPECHRAWRIIRINGGNRKRGLMAWARLLSEEMK